MQVVEIIPVMPQWHIHIFLSTMVFPQLQFLDKVIDVPVVRVVQFLRSRSHACCVRRQVPWLRSEVAAFNKVVYTPVVAQSLIPMASQTIEIFLLSYVWWFMSH